MTKLTKKEKDKMKLVCGCELVLDAGKIKFSKFVCGTHRYFRYKLPK